MYPGRYELQEELARKIASERETIADGLLDLKSDYTDQLIDGARDGSRRVGDVVAEVDWLRIVVAFGNCVSLTAKAAAAAQQQARVNAAKECWTERKADPAAFKANYGTNKNKSNAFGKCVSGKVKHSGP
jgi:hypothetical protein